MNEERMRVIIREELANQEQRADREKTELMYIKQDVHAAVYGGIRPIRPPWMEE